MDPHGLLPARPPIGPQPPERSDAARNRARLLDAAQRIVDCEGIAGVTMDGLAAEAGVGKGTVFRRFGSRAGVFAALLDDVEREFQARFLSGPPPLGPGADPVERLVAFGRARIEVLARQAPLMRAAERPVEERFEVPARVVVEVHIATLLRQSGVELDVPVIAFELLAVLEAPLLLPEADLTPAKIIRLGDGWERLVRALLR
ncbi:TetR/AcrR family transcriptional regulator [Herbiconiux moechotypicola]|uniref:TetR/AcrR family transcriptional regulator n=1 Tax=Herbiconiux moechotypicola TaxID=637393 RepID=A0ABN3D9G2_9MICO|nr:TetR/AcrR family transcriptional regulator [Herbiconiux moechotypicola]MCS5729059.1 TetR/AcrR family transcriptional regulator [Herbiconiux moechotypicola]